MQANSKVIILQFSYNLGHITRDFLVILYYYFLIYILHITSEVKNEATIIEMIQQARVLKIRPINIQKDYRMNVLVFIKKLQYSA